MNKSNTKVKYDYNRLNTEEFVKRARLKHGDKYDYSLCNYAHSRTPISIICRKCQITFKQSPDHHLMGNKGRGSGCPNCKKQSLRLTEDEFIQQSISVHGDKYDYSQTHYVDMRTKVTIFCKKCNKTFKQQPRAHANQKQGCPECKHSHGESKIALLLRLLDLNYVAQHSFPDCKSSRSYALKFDFYVASLNLCIEYDGEQHFDKKNKWWSKYVEENDRIKEQYCIKKGILLQRISYKEFDKVEAILSPILLPSKH